jgi:uncharacterized Zn finger protein
MTTEPRETTQPMRCPNCGDDTTHLVIEWTFSTTRECSECGAIYEGDHL